MGGSCIKFTFVVVNLVILLFGGVLLGVGIVGQNAHLNSLLNANLYTGLAIVLIVAGALLVLISFLGCCGACLESKCLLSTFFCLVLILFVVVGAGAITSFVLGSESILQQIRTSLNNSINSYNDTDAVKQSWNFFQDNFECCGIDSSADWTNVLGPSVVPPSCCKKDSKGVPIACSAGSNSTYSDGCVDKLDYFVEENSEHTFYSAIALEVFLLISMIVSCVIQSTS